jgi:hypothetical protein
MVQIGEKLLQIGEKLLQIGERLIADWRKTNKGIKVQIDTKFIKQKIS